MNSKESGLTVGELTMAIAALILLAAVWSSFDKKKDTNKSEKINESSSLVYRSHI